LLLSHLELFMSDSCLYILLFVDVFCPLLLVKTGIITTYEKVFFLFGDPLNMALDLTTHNNEQ